MKLRLRLRKVKYGTAPDDMLLLYNEYGIQDYAVLEYWHTEVGGPFEWRPVEIVDDI